MAVERLAKARGKGGYNHFSRGFSGIVPIRMEAFLFPFSTHGSPEILPLNNIAGFRISHEQYPACYNSWENTDVWRFWTALFIFYVFKNNTNKLPSEQFLSRTIYSTVIVVTIRTKQNWNEKNAVLYVRYCNSKTQHLVGIWDERTSYG